MTLYFLQYNNYYNRLFKKENTVLQYQNAGSIVHTIYSTDFNENDGVVTEKIANIDLDSIPDYCLVCEENNTIVSRWFVTECIRTRKGQYRIRLQRDVIADYYENIESAPVFLEKGYVNINSDLIFNAENMTFSQIKRSERLLKDNTKIPWIVGYYTLPTAEEEDNVIDFGPSAFTPDSEGATLADYTWYSYTSNKPNNDPYIHITDRQYAIVTNYAAPRNLWTTSYRFNENGSIDSLRESSTGISWQGLTLSYTDTEEFNGRINSLTKQDLGACDASLRATVRGVSDATYENLVKQDGKIFKTTSDNKYYIVKLRRDTWSTPQTEGSSISSDTVPVVNNSSLFVNLSNLFNSKINSPAIFGGSINQNQSNPQYNTFQYKASGQSVYLELVELPPSSGLTLTVTKERRQLIDAPYCMFCIPYGEIELVHSQGTLTTEPLNGLNLGSAFLETTQCYDVQILPYCPIPEIRDAGIIDTTRMVQNLDYNLPTELALSQTVVLWCMESKGTFTIPYNYSLSRDPVEFKVESLAYMHRLCSPNYSSIFEFNACKNGGINYFDVDYTYKPYSPYIHVNPDFKRLYGQDFNDPRGLILSGDFSVTSVKDQWQQYELQNKNYQQMFNRQIENMETTRQLQRYGQIASIVGGVGSGTAQGAYMGAAAGPVGAVVGGALGGVASLAGGIADYAISEAAHAEALDYSKDLFGMQLDNIKALPNTLTKVTAFNNNNKLFPVLEFYVCTTEEEIALRNKLKYNGMSLGVIYDPFSSRQRAPERWYYKGLPIRLENLAEDYHIANAIAAELNKGVYIE